MPFPWCFPTGHTINFKSLISLFLKEKCDVKFVVAVFSGGQKIHFHSTLKA